MASFQVIAQTESGKEFRLSHEITWGEANMEDLELMAARFYRFINKQQYTMEKKNKKGFSVSAKASVEKLSPEMQKMMEKKNELDAETEATARVFVKAYIKHVKNRTVRLVTLMNGSASAMYNLLLSISEISDFKLSVDELMENYIETCQNMMEFFKANRQPDQNNQPS